MSYNFLANVIYQLQNKELENNEESVKVSPGGESSKRQTSGTMNSIGSEQATAMPAQQIAKSLQVDLRTGLSKREAHARLRVFGYNEFNVQDEQSLLSKYSEQVANLKR